MALIADETIKRTKHAVAPVTTIEWNPQDNTGAVTFHVQVEVSEDGKFSHYESANPLIVPLADILPRTFTVGDYKVPAMLLMGAIKVAFDEFYTERVGI